MLQIRKILVPTDGSACAERAYGLAADLADRYGAELHAVHVSEPADDGPDLHSDTWDDIAAKLSSGGDSPSSPIHVEDVETADSSLGRVLLGYADRLGADLIVMGTAGRRGFARFFLGSVTEEVVESSSLPVLTVPCRTVLEDGPVLLPVDFTAGSREALLHGKELAVERGVPLHVFHVLEWPTSPPPYFGDLSLTPVSKVLGRAQHDLETLVADVIGHGVAASVRVRMGRTVADAVASYAEEIGAGLIILYTHQRKGIDRLIMGRVSDKVLRTVSCPVLAIRPGTCGLLPDGVVVEGATSASPLADGSHAL